MAEEPAPSTRKDSNGKKTGWLFRSSTLFPQATFVQQLGLDKLTARMTPPQADNNLSPAPPQDAEPAQPDRAKRKPTFGKGQDNALIKSPTTPPHDNDTTNTSQPNNAETTLTSPTSIKHSSSETLNSPEPGSTKNNTYQNGKRFRGFSADAPGLDTPDRPPITMRSNTVVPATRTAVEPTVKVVEPPLPQSPQPSPPPQVSPHQSSQVTVQKTLSPNDQGTSINIFVHVRD